MIFNIVVDFDWFFDSVKTRLDWKRTAVIVSRFCASNFLLHFSEPFCFTVQTNFELQFFSIFLSNALGVKQTHFRFVSVSHQQQLFVHSIGVWLLYSSWLHKQFSMSLPSGWVWTLNLCDDIYVAMTAVISSPCPAPWANKLVTNTLQFCQ